MAKTTALTAQPTAPHARMLREYVLSAHPPTLLTAYRTHVAVWLRPSSAI